MQIPSMKKNEPELFDIKVKFREANNGWSQLYSYKHTSEIKAKTFVIVLGTDGFPKLACVKSGDGPHVPSKDFKTKDILRVTDLTLDNIK